MSILTAAVRTTHLAGLAVLVGATGAFAQTTTIPASAAPAPDDSVVNLSPFLVSEEGNSGYQAQSTVTGSRSAKDLIDLASSISIINLEMMSDLGATTVHDVFKYGASGVTQNQSFNEDVTIRGFRLGGTLRDGAPRQTTKFAPMYDVERIEVLKGPAAMLTGVNAGIGGTINYVSRAASAKRAGEIEAKVTDNGAIRLQANTTGSAYKSENFKVNYRLTLGFLDSEAPHDKPIEFEDQKFYGAGLAFYFGQATSVIVNGYYFIDNDYNYLEDFLDNTARKDSFTNLTDAVLNQYSTATYAPARRKDAFWNLSATSINITMLNHLTENGNLRIAYYYGASDDRRDNPRGSTVQANNYIINRQDVRNNNAIENHSFQLDYLHKWTTKWFVLDTTLGADGYSNRTWMDQSVTIMPSIDTRTGLYPDDDAWFARFPTDDSYFITPRPASVGGPATRTAQKATSLSYYYQENLSLWKDRIILVGGQRWYRPNQVDTNYVANTVTDANLNRFKVHKYGAIVKPFPNVSLYYTDAQNVFPPAVGFTDKFLQGDMLGERFKPSLGTLKEYGVKFQYSPWERLDLYGTFAHFEMAQTNIKTVGILENGLFGNIQSAQDECKGIEVDLGARLKFATGRADLLVSFSDGNSAIAADKGKAYVQQANGFAEKKGSGLAKYTFTGGPLNGFMVGAGIEKESHRRNVTYSLYHPPIIDAFAGYTWGKHWNVQLNLANVTNKRYIVQVFNTALVQTSDSFRASLTTRYKF